MKKVLLLICLGAMVVCSCNKSCTCAISSTNQDQEIEIAYNEDCSDYSNANRTCM